MISPTTAKPLHKPEVMESRSAHTQQSPIREFMTPMPHTIGRDQSLSIAHEHMHAWNVRHLPVLDGGTLVGILSQRDVLLVETLRDVDPTKVPVEDAMSTDLYVVDPDVPLSDVAAVMADRKYGCAIVASGRHVVGIFTTIDALRILFPPRKEGSA
jgi:acetoin utilization protein AcuB